MSLIQSHIEKKLRDNFVPTILQIRDDSHKHAGHHHGSPNAFTGQEGTHFHIYMVSSVFEQMTRIERYRSIHHCLQEELANNIHALSLDLKSPSEAT